MISHPTKNQSLLGVFLLSWGLSRLDPLSFSYFIIELNVPHTFNFFPDLKRALITPSSEQY